MTSSGEQTIIDLFPGANNPFPDPARPPLYMRATLYAFRPSSLSEWRQTGRWWNQYAVGPHVMAHSLHSTGAAAAAEPRSKSADQSDAFWINKLPCAESFHPEHWVWCLRVPRFQRLIADYRAAALTAKGSAGSKDQGSAAVARSLMQFPPRMDSVSATGASPEDLQQPVTVDDFWEQFIDRMRSDVALPDSSSPDQTLAREPEARGFAALATIIIQDDRASWRELTQYITKRLRAASTIKSRWSQFGVITGRLFVLLMSQLEPLYSRRQHAFAPRFSVRHVGIPNRHVRTEDAMSRSPTDITEAGAAQHTAEELALDTLFHVALLCYRVIFRGRAVYEQVLADVTQCNQLDAARIKSEAGAWPSLPMSCKLYDSTVFGSDIVHLGDNFSLVMAVQAEVRDLRRNWSSGKYTTRVPSYLSAVKTAYVSRCISDIHAVRFSGMFLLAAFRLEALQFNARKYRLLLELAQLPRGSFLPGFLMFIDWMCDNIHDEVDDSVPDQTGETIMCGMNCLERYPEIERQDTEFTITFRPGSKRGFLPDVRDIAAVSTAPKGRQARSSKLE